MRGGAANGGIAREDGKNGSRAREGAKIAKGCVEGRNLFSDPDQRFRVEMVGPTFAAKPDPPGKPHVTKSAPPGWPDPTGEPALRDLRVFA